MEKDKLWYLKKFNLFETMGMEEMESISQMVAENQITKKQPVYLEGDPSENLYFLKKGRVKITRIDESGKEFTLTLMEPGEIFGEMGMFDDAPRETTAVALEDSLICTMRRGDFEKLMENKPELSFKLNKLMGLRLRRIENRIQELLFRDVPSRLASLILRLLDQHSREMRDGVRINIKLSQQEIANLIGATREMTSSVINSFKKDGLISIESKYIYILDKKELEKFVSPR
ncbi:Crp/Fnr family transcriptional regulator [candidate division KSB1 bacterium]|nr:Crp/Fnr family transcriptional regulator [candidate division KSB1 bacterium]